MSDEENEDSNSQISASSSTIFSQQGKTKPKIIVENISEFSLKNKPKIIVDNISDFSFTPKKGSVTPIVSPLQRLDFQKLGKKKKSPIKVSKTVSDRKWRALSKPLKRKPQKNNTSLFLPLSLVVATKKKYWYLPQNTC